MQVCVSEWLLVILPNPILEFWHAPLPPKCCEPGSMPQLLTFLLFSPETHILVYQGTSECVTLGSISCTFPHLWECVSHLNTLSWLHGPLQSTLNRKVDVKFVTFLVSFFNVSPRDLPICCTISPCFGLLALACNFFIQPLWRFFGKLLGQGFSECF